MGSGAFPVSQAMAWHGGLHITAPSANESVRAIADGVVILRREGGTATYDSKEHSTGCVVIRHTTEIGATTGPNGPTAVEVTYYSIYQHLRTLDPGLPGLNKPIYRKDKLGLAGTIHDKENRIHLEIIAGDADTQKLINRSAGELPVDKDGRTDTVYGQLYVLLPAKSACYSTQPGNAPLPAPSGDSGDAKLIVGIQYQQGHATLTTYQMSGDIVGQAPVETNAEYNLYAEANKRHGALSAREQANSSPSGWYELLRFGRKLGTDPLPANAAHWRKVVLPGHPQGAWVNLNAAGTYKFSDADFPHWMGWTLISDDTEDHNSQCNSALIDAMLSPAAQPKAAPAGAPSLSGPATPPPQPAETAQTTPQQKAANRQQNLCKPAVQEKLARTVCKFPTEWSKNDVKTRWKWTQAQGNPYLPHPLKADDFDTMVAFAEKLCFWEDLPPEDKNRLTLTHWHFHPREFISHFRKCGWLSGKELAQLIPKNIIRKPGSHTSRTTAFWESPDINTAQRFIANHKITLNFSLRKFLITTPLRISCFFGNATQETQWFSLLRESNGRDNTLHDGWYGRGFLQLTNPNGDINNGINNYYKYFKFLGRKPSTPPGNQEFNWRDEIGTNAHHAAHSAGAYWVWDNKSSPTQDRPNRPQVDNANKYADSPANNQRRTISTGSNGTKVWYYNQSFTNSATAVNYPASTGQNPPNMNGLVDRSVAFINALIVLSELPTFEDNQQGISFIPENFEHRRVS